MVLEMDEEKSVLIEELSKLRDQFVQMYESNKQQILTLNIICEKDAEITAQNEMIQKFLKENQS